MADKVTKTPEEWRKQLTPEQYAVAREKGTERAFSGKYYKEHDSGLYRCVCCGNPLFSSDTSSSREPAGRASTRRSPKRTSKRKPIPNTE
jgi:Conserved domain frequently associated with peptide methionine sulfoxide reductase